MSDVGRYHRMTLDTPHNEGRDLGLYNIGDYTSFKIELLIHYDANNYPLETPIPVTLHLVPEDKVD